METQEKMESSTRRAPRFTVNAHREGNDKIASFFRILK